MFVRWGVRGDVSVFRVGAGPPVVADGVEEVGTVFAGVEILLGQLAEHVLRGEEFPAWHVDGQVAFVP